MHYSPLKFNRCFGETYRLHLRGQRISRAKFQRENEWQAEQSCSSEMSVDFQRITRLYNPENTVLQIYFLSHRLRFSETNVAETRNILLLIPDATGTALYRCQYLLTQNKLRGLSPRANYIDRATTA
jgi:hypothetical protein